MLMLMLPIANRRRFGTKINENADHHFSFHKFIIVVIVIIIIVVVVIVDAATLSHRFDSISSTFSPHILLPF